MADREEGWTQRPQKKVTDSEYLATICWCVQFIAFVVALHALGAAYFLIRFWSR